MIAGGADPSARDEAGATPPHRSVALPRSGDGPLPSPQIVQALREAGADMHAVDPHGSTPAAWAAAAQDSDPQAVVDRSLEMLRLLVGHGARADVPRHPARGESFSHYCTAAPSVHAFMLDHGAPVDAVDNHGNTPLHDAVRCARPPSGGNAAGTGSRHPSSLAHATGRPWCRAARAGTGRPAAGRTPLGPTSPPSAIRSNSGGPHADSPPFRAADR
ncbi:ankyrin repeat domain-containing protein [Streptomyces sp. NPDC002476]|uniref:ankyrin repeat domain-containing protein n=1 Tax=Streptomyces sp. NPDC002476 TaxID=3364648 RepID=UPI0036857FAE